MAAEAYPIAPARGSVELRGDVPPSKCTSKTGHFCSENAAAGHSGQLELASQLGLDASRFEQRLEPIASAGVFAMDAARKDQLVLERVLPPGQLGDGKLIAEAFQSEHSHHIGQM